MFLNCHSYHSLRYGTIPLDTLITQGESMGATTMVLTDINTITGIYDFAKACHQVGIKPIAGMELRGEGRRRFIGIAHNHLGIGELNRFLTYHNFENVPLPYRAPAFKNVSIIYGLNEAPESLAPHEYIGIRPDEVTKLYGRQFEKDKLVVLNPVTLSCPTDFELHRVLRAIDLNVVLTKLTVEDYCHESDYMIPIDSLTAAYEGHPHILANTEKLLAGCTFDFDFSTPKNKRFFTGSKKSDIELLTNLAQDGMIRRYGKRNQQAKARVVKELKVINELDFCAYFLIVWDIVRYSNSMGYMHVGRGSGANSIVAYCLGITDICPLELDLYFERFLNSSRKSPPDFDIDWSWQNRDTILEYIFTRFGRDHVAFTGTIAKFKYRSIFREVGKVYGLPKEELDAMAKKPMHQHDYNSVVAKVQQMGKMLEKFPNMRSMHSCGILISEEPITNYSALEMPPKGFPIVQFDMHIAEDVGFEKFDILSQRGLGSISDALQIILDNRGERVDIRDLALSKNEALCSDYLGAGKTIGCFYIESPAMRGLLRRLKCRDYKTLVAASSIIRPGVAQSGMMREYIFRHNNPDKFEYYHDVFEQQLGETYGIMVYQEDVIKIALHFAGLEPAYGDILRRAISGKGRSLQELQTVKNRFFECCREKGHPIELSEEVYRQIESFAGYSFCKAHSASYAVESYQALYLKVYYGIEFMVAVINNEGGFYRTEIYVHEAKMSGAKINCPCVNHSEVGAALFGKEIYLGFRHLKSLDAKTIENIIESRERDGNFTSLENFVSRVPIGIETLQALIFIGAFRFTGLPKNELILNARLLLVTYTPENLNPTLFVETAKEFTLPKLFRHEFEDAFDEIELLSFPVSCTPFDLLQTKFRGDVMAKDLLKFHRREVRMLAYLVSIKHVPTKMGEMFFGTWIDVEGSYFDTAHFNDCLQKYPFKSGGCYLILGMVEVDFHFPTITVTKMAKMPFVPDPRYSDTPNKQYTAQARLKEDVSMTHRNPYPQQHEIGLPRHKMQ